MCDIDETEELPVTQTRSLFYIQTLCIDLHSSPVHSIGLHKLVLFVCCNQFLKKKKKKMLAGSGVVGKWQSVEIITQIQKPRTATCIIGMDAGRELFFPPKCILYAWKPTLIRINEAPCLNLIHCLIHPWYLLTCGV